MGAPHPAGQAASASKIESVTVAVADAYLDQFSVVVERCKRVGLQIQSQMKLLGVLTGLIANDKLPALAKVEGVASVERSWNYTTLPKDEP